MDHETRRRLVDFPGGRLNWRPFCRQLGNGTRAWWLDPRAATRNGTDWQAVRGTHKRRALLL